MCRAIYRWKLVPANYRNLELSALPPQVLQAWLTVNVPQTGLLRYCTSPKLFWEMVVDCCCLFVVYVSFLLGTIRAPERNGNVSKTIRLITEDKKCM